MSAPETTAAQELVSQGLPAFLRGECTLAELAGIRAEDAGPLLRAALAHHAAGRPDAAQPLFSALSALWPTFYLPHHYLGLLAMREGSVAKAHDHWMRAAELLEAGKPLSAAETRTLHDALYLAAEARVRLGEKDAALSLLKGLAQRPEGVEPSLRAQVERRIAQLSAEDWWSQP